MRLPAGKTGPAGSATSSHLVKRKQRGRRVEDEARKRPICNRSLIIQSPSRNSISCFIQSLRLCMTALVVVLIEIMAQVPQNAGTGDYVKAPETYQREMPIGEQLVQLKDAAKGKINELADQANIRYDQAQNDPANPASDERLARDVDATTQHAATSVETAKGQVGSAVDAFARTAQSVKGAFVATRNEGTATPTSPNVPQQPAPAQSVSESLGQTAATVTDAVKNLFAPRQTAPGTQPGLDKMAADIPQDVPRRAPQ